MYMYILGLTFTFEQINLVHLKGPERRRSNQAIYMMGKVVCDKTNTILPSLNGIFQV